jgi:MSHA biogenesis protein MshI
MKHLRDAKPEDREDVFNRVLLELQRTLDNFERQFGSIGVSRIMAGPEPEDTGLITFLNAYLGMPVRRVDLTAVIDAGEGVSLDMDTQWRLFHPIGATLRSGAQAQ